MNPISNSGLPKSELMRNLRKDAFAALLAANPTVSRQVLRDNSRILAKDWYRRIQSGEIQFGVRVENGRDGEQKSAGADQLPVDGSDRVGGKRRKRVQRGFRQWPRQ